MLVAGAAFLAVLALALLIVRAGKESGTGNGPGRGNWAVAVHGARLAMTGPANEVDALEPLDGSTTIPLNPGLLGSPEGLVIGSDAELCHVQIRDSSISSRHVRCRSIRGDLWIEDLQSETGTHVDDAPAEPFMPLQVGPGQVLRIGNHAYNLAASSYGAGT